MRRVNFSQRLKDQQITWALANGISSDWTEADAKPTQKHVLLKDYQAKNLFNPSWWGLIKDKEHRWARALTSSQCFAVNLFAPMTSYAGQARHVYQFFFPERPLEPDDKVIVELEFTPKGKPNWLGEKNQPTQVDACFIISRGNKKIGYGLVEVKLSEAKFGSCRGPKPRSNDKGNKTPERCQDFESVYSNPETQCWLAEEEGRKYWSYLKQKDFFDFGPMTENAACPFQGGLYQLMRNRVLALALVEHGGASWADVAVCIHPGNEHVYELKKPVAGSSNVLSAFNSLMPGYDVKIISPGKLVEVLANGYSDMSGWADYMRSRYLLCKSQLIQAGR